VTLEAPAQREPLFGDTNTRVRDVRVDKDGAVIALSEDGKLIRIVPK
jgi:glucose/arabinose dehydrogenase